MDEPVVLALDLASGGATAALVTPSLDTVSSFESPWRFVDEGSQSYGLAPVTVWNHVAEAIGEVTRAGPTPAAIVLTSMMHTLLVTDLDGSPRGPVRTWRDRAHTVDPSRWALDPRAYRERTGCYLHPSFPATKLMALRRKRSEELREPFRLESIKGHVHWILTGERIEDLSTASASGLVDLDTGFWDLPTLDALELDLANLPAIVDPAVVAGTVRPRAADRTGLPEDLPVVAGLGDGFAATLGSAGARAGHLAVTMGTTSSVRTVRTSPHREMDGTFCYRFGRERFLTGCASSNGGNLFDWARTTFDVREISLGPRESDTVPLFLPFLEGERSPFWDAGLEPRWVDVERARTVEDLAAAVVESAVFGIRLATTRVEHVEGSISSAVLSGNAFRDHRVGDFLADLVDFPIFAPAAPGEATLRGAARIAFETLGVDTEGAIEAMLEQAARVGGSGEDAIRERRRERYRRFASALGSSALRS